MLGITDTVNRLLSTSHMKALNEAQSNKIKDRIKAVEYYNGEQRDYIKEYLSFSDRNRQDKIPYTISNITRRIIDRTSTTYMNKPQRLINGKSNDNYNEWTKQKDRSMLMADRFTAQMSSIY